MAAVVARNMPGKYLNENLALDGGVLVRFN